MNGEGEVYVWKAKLNAELNLGLHTRPGAGRWDTENLELEAGTNPDREAGETVTHLPPEEKKKKKKKMESELSPMTTHTHTEQHESDYVEERSALKLKSPGVFIAWKPYKRERNTR